MELYTCLYYNKKWLTKDMKAVRKKMERLDEIMKKRLVSFILMLAMAIAVLSPLQSKEAAAQENANISVSEWAIPDLIFGDTYGIYPMEWYEKDLTENIKNYEFRLLLYGLRRKIVESGCALETGKAKPVIDESITVEEAIEAFYTMLSNFEYTIDLGFSAGFSPVEYMLKIGAYTGENGEQGLKELCSREQAMVMATRIVALFYDALGASSKGFLWEVKSGGNTVYLLGSVHLASTDLYPLSYKIWSAYINSDALVVEADIYNTSDLLAMADKMFYMDGSSLKDHLSSETYRKVVEAGLLMGYSEETLALIKPWALYLLLSNYSILSTSAGDTFSSQLGVDSQFLINAHLYQKPIYAVESIQKQIEIIESFSDGLIEYLIYTGCENLLQMRAGKTSSYKFNAELKALYKAWKEGDVHAFRKLKDIDSTFEAAESDEIKAYQEEYNAKMLHQRDDAMAEYIDALLKSEGENTYFVVLGAAHLISDYSVIDRLKNAGYMIMQIR